MNDVIQLCFEAQVNDVIQLCVEAQVNNANKQNYKIQNVVVNR